MARPVGGRVEMVSARSAFSGFLLRVAVRGLEVCRARSYCRRSPGRPGEAVADVDHVGAVAAGVDPHKDTVAKAQGLVEPAQLDRHPMAEHAAVSVSVS